MLSSTLRLVFYQLCDVGFGISKAMDDVLDGIIEFVKSFTLSQAFDFKTLTEA